VGRRFRGRPSDPGDPRDATHRTPNVDLTPRAKPFIRRDGINILDAELPAGEYILRVDVKDTDGRSASTIFTLKVEP
jgi:hypothetical protein